MTEESEIDDVIYQHPLSWRSLGRLFDCMPLTVSIIITKLLLALNKLISKLDRRRSKKGRKSGTFMAKERVKSIQSTLSPPKNAPKWTLVSSEYNTESSSGQLQSSLTPTSGEHLIHAHPRGSFGSGSSSSGACSTPSSELLSRTSERSTPQSASSSRPRNLLEDIFSCTEDDGVADHPRSLEPLLNDDRSDSMDSSSDSDY